MLSVFLGAMLNRLLTIFCNIYLSVQSPWRLSRGFIIIKPHLLKCSLSSGSSSDVSFDLSPAQRRILPLKQRLKEREGKQKLCSRPFLLTFRKINSALPGTIISPTFIPAYFTIMFKPMKGDLRFIYHLLRTRTIPAGPPERR